MIIADVKSNTTKKQYQISENLNSDSKLLSSKSNMSFHMVIDILNNNVIQGLPFDKNNNSFQKNGVNLVKLYN